MVIKFKTIVSGVSSENLGVLSSTVVKISHNIHINNFMLYLLYKSLFKLIHRFVSTYLTLITIELPRGENEIMFR